MGLSRGIFDGSVITAKRNKGEKFSFIQNIPDLHRMSMSKFAFNSSVFADNNKEQLEKYQCPKCQYILRDAVQTSCGHWLCQGCAEEIFKKK